jgi:opacity protein-like surface antigen
VLGGGRTFCNNFYFGGEGLLDFTRTSNKEVKLSDGSTTAKVKTRGATPELALRLGYVTKGWMFYAKPAVLFPKVTYKIAGEDKSICKTGYSVALGLDKSFCKKFSARLEGEYVFRRNKEWGTHKARVGDGFNIRALCSYSPVSF